MTALPPDAHGAPRVNAHGALPVNAHGALPVNAHGALPVNAHGAMIGALRDLLDKIAAADAPEALLGELTQNFRQFSDRLAGHAHQKFDPVLAIPPDQLDRARALTPAVTNVELDDRTIKAGVRFGRHFGESRVHGGAIPLLLLDVLGKLINSGPRPTSRTAYFHIDYRSGTPTDEDLLVRGWIVSENGRKRVLRCELRHGDTLCAEAEGLFIAVERN